MLPPSTVKSSKEPATLPTGKVLRLPLRESDANLLASLADDPNRALAGIFDRYSSDVERVLYRILGPDSEICDVLHDVFVTAISSLDKLRDEAKLRSWLVGIAVHKARKLIRRRKLRRIVQCMAPFELPEHEATLPTAEISEALRHTYSLLARLPADDRIAFALRHVDGMDLTSIAQATGVSLATAKRRIARGQQTFVELARQHETLADWLERGTLAG
jgi:RNA polymerase sigma-70 factor, ECF subfamily